MSFTKFARAELLEVRATSSKVKTASLSSFADMGTKVSTSGDVDEQLREILATDGYLYLKTRAISSRNNRNNDAWGSNELQKAYRTFIGKPYFVEHKNFDPKRARGVVVDASVHVDEDGKTASLDPYYASDDCHPEHKPPTWVDCLVEVDAKSFPRLARAILAGELDSVSMGANVGFTRCSVCDNRAEDASEFCDHVRLKGARFEWPDENGVKQMKLAYERCFDVGFFELSAVADPADETALMYRDTIGKPQKAASVQTSDIARHAHTITFKTDEAVDQFLKQAERPKPPRSEETTAPTKIDTLAQQETCDVCGSDLQDGACEICGWSKPPDGFDRPDLEKAQKVDEAMRENEAQQDLADAEVERIEDAKHQPPQAAQQSSPARSASAGDTSSERLASQRGSDQGRINVRERPILPPGTRISDKPLKAVTISDQHRPVESSKGNSMSQKQAIQTGAEKQVSVTGVGAVTPEPSPLKVVDVDAVGGVAPAPEAEKQNIEKNVNVIGGPTETWSSEEGQESAVTSETGENLQTVHASTDKDAAAVPGPEVEAMPDTIDVETPIGSEEVGDATKTWSGKKRQENPVDSDTGENLQTVARRHAFACMKLAEAEIELGITDAEDKYQRVSDLEDESLDEIEAQIKTLAKVHTAGLKKAPQRRKLTASRMPSMRTASAPVVTEVEDVDDSFFL